MRPGYTLVELSVILAILGVVSAMALPRFAAMRDRLAVYGATSALATALIDTRHRSMRETRYVAFTVDTASGLVVVRANVDTLDRHPLGELFGISLRASRDSIAYYPTGLGYGAANSTYVVARGAAAETVTVSRAGRVKR
jgi:prepilin-type N-terminal cleavage/methylation domain-containing protein